MIMMIMAIALRLRHMRPFRGLAHQHRILLLLIEVNNKNASAGRNYR